MYKPIVTQRCDVASDMLVIADSAYGMLPGHQAITSTMLTCHKNNLQEHVALNFHS